VKAIALGLAHVRVDDAAGGTPVSHRKISWKKLDAFEQARLKEAGDAAEVKQEWHWRAVQKHSSRSNWLHGSTAVRPEQLGVNTRQDVDGANGVAAPPGTRATWSASTERLVMRGEPDLAVALHPVRPDSSPSMERSTSGAALSSGSDLPLAEASAASSAKYTPLSRAISWLCRARARSPLGRSNFWRYRQVRVTHAPHAVYRPADWALRCGAGVTQRRMISIKLRTRWRQYVLLASWRR
jgi:hypothetical protein